MDIPTEHHRIFVTVFTEDPEKIYSLSSYFHDFPHIRLQCKSKHTTEHSSDIIVLPADCIEAGKTEQLVSSEFSSLIAYGHPDQLKNAFLAGCCDYLKDPWSSEELHYRVLKNAKVSFNTFHIDTICFFPFYAHSDNKVIPLSKREYSILYLLVKNRNRIVSRLDLSIALWGCPKPNSRAIDMHVSSIRNKMKTAGFDRFFSIETIHGEGYCIP